MIVVEYKVYVIIFLLCVDIIQVCLAVVWFVLSFRHEQVPYPEIAKENGVQGRVTLQFTVEKDGSVTKVKVLRGVDPSLDKEAVRVVSMSPKWKPGKQRDRAVPVTYTFPVIFQLR